MLGRPVREVPCAFLAWLVQYIAAPGKRALVLIWDNASWHSSHVVQTWSKAYTRSAKREGGWRWMVCRLPSKRPWLHPLEPKWVHGKRAGAEPARRLSMSALRQRVCAYYQCTLTDPMAQADC